MLTLTEYEILRLAMNIYRYIIKNHLVDIQYDTSTEDIIQTIKIYPINDDKVGEIKRSYDVNTMPYSIYVQSLIILADNNLI